MADNVSNHSKAATKRWIRDKLTTETRFWSKVDKRTPEECWRWLGGFYNSGYAVFRVGTKTSRGHRVSYELNCGPIPDGLLVCHKCDNKWCVNPNHLFLGTTRDNTIDMLQKGRHRTAKGDAHPFCKFKEDFVRTVKTAYATQQDKTLREIAREFNLSMDSTHHIIYGRPHVSA